MPRPRSLKPAYTIDKASNRARVDLDGKRHYLGPANSPESRDKYDRLIGEWIARGRRPAPTAAADPDSGITVTAVVAAFWTHAKIAYPSSVAEGKHPDGELGNFRSVLRLLKRLYGPTPAIAFGPLKLKVVREEMIAVGWCRKNVNRQTGRLKHVFKWAVENELLPGSIHHALSAVEGLRAGRSTARETEPIPAAPDAAIAAVLPIVSRQVRALIELQVVTGMRPGEALLMRWRDVDMSDRDLWVYRPAQHKTKHHGHTRTIYLGPKAQEILWPFRFAGTDGYLFSPADAEAERRAALTAKRAKKGTPASCGNGPGDNRAASPKRSPGKRYIVKTYRAAIHAACDVAFPPPDRLVRLRIAGRGRKHKSRRLETATEWKARLGAEAWKEVRAWRDANRWSPNQLRHNAATRFRKEFGIEAARVLLGHRTMAVTEMYAEVDVAKAMRIMREVG